MLPGSPDDKAVVFLSASRAQTDDALCIAGELSSGLHLSLLAVHATAVPCRQSCTGNEIPCFPVKRIRAPFIRPIDLFFQILLARRALTVLARRHRRLVLVLGDDINPLERSLIAYANRLAVPTLLVLEGTLQDPELEKEIQAASRLQNVVRRLARFVLAEVGLLPWPVLYGQGGCRCLAVWGEHSLQMMRQRQVPNHRLCVTGSPRFDRLFKIVQEGRHVRPHSRKRLLFAGVILSTFNLAPFEVDCKVMTVLDRIAMDNPQWEIVIRPHPLDKLEIYRQVFRIHNLTGVKIEHETSAEDALMNCDILMVYDSTIAIEGMILGKPVVSLVVAPHISRVVYVRDAAVLPVAKLEDLAAALHQVLEDPETSATLAESQERFLSRLFAFRDGTSSERVARIIEGLLGDPTVPAATLT